MKVIIVLVASIVLCQGLWWAPVKKNRRIKQLKPAGLVKNGFEGILESVTEVRNEEKCDRCKRFLEEAQTELTDASNMEEVRNVINDMLCIGIEYKGLCTVAVGVLVNGYMIYGGEIMDPATDCAFLQLC